MQVDSQAVWTRPSQGSDPSALELTSVSPCHTANQREPTTPRRRQLACMGLTKFEDGIRQWPTDGLGGENIYHRLRPLSRCKLSAQQKESRLTGRLDPALAGVRSFGTGAYVRDSKPHSRSAGAYDSLTTAAGKHGAHTQNLKLGSGSGPLTGSAGRLSTTVGAPSVGANCQHSRMEVNSQAVRTRPSQGSDPYIQNLKLELGSSQLTGSARRRSTTVCKPQ